MSEEGPVIYGGRYELHRRLARGGMADVYLARDQLLDRPVAVKVLFPQYAADPAFVERFRREAQSAANLNHPNIAGVYDWGEEAGTYYIVMEYVAGRSLSDVLRQEGTLLPERAAEIGIDVAAALGFAHRNGVVHRDVKPGNVLVSSDGHVKVVDFGIARAMSAVDDNLTQTGLVMGTATYFSPEQAQGKSVDPRSDIYSLGVMMYEMVAGQPPFRGDDALAVAYQHVQERPTPPTEINPNLELTLEAIILKCLAKAATNRYPSAEDLRADLRRYREGEQMPVQAPLRAAAPIPPPEQRADATQAMPATRAVPAATAVGGHYDSYDTDSIDPYVYEEVPKRNGAFIAVLVLLLAVVGVLLYLLANSLGILDNGDQETVTGELIAVESVVGQSADDAKAALEAQGFVVNVLFEQSDTVPDGQVISQDPEAGEMLEVGETVTLTVSEAEALADIPDVRGLTQVEAIQQLNDAGFLDTRVEPVFDDDVEADRVIETDPPFGEQAALSTQIVVRVSQGVEERTVPETAGRTVAEAKTVLETADFLTAQANEFSDSVPAGVVIRSEPGFGSVQPRGATITLIVSAGVERITVPNVVEKTLETAREELETALFTVNVQEQTLLPGDPDIGRVISQDPAGQTTAPKGSTVTIVVGKAPLTTTTTTTTTTSTPPTTGGGGGGGGG